MKSKNKIVSIVLFLSVFMMLVSCGKQEKVERIMEDGVEVVINHIEPYKIKGEPTALNLEKEFTIDTKRNNLVELGIYSIDEYDIDSEGSIYFSSSEQLFKFDNEGNFIQTIGRKGQGPGEYQDVDTLKITSSGEISVYDAVNAKFLFFDSNGKLKEEIKKKATIFAWECTYLDNGNYLLRGQQNVREKAIRMYQYVLLDNNFNKIKDLQPRFSIDVANFKPDRINLLRHENAGPCSGVSNDKIFVASNMKEDLEIEVYNFQGDLLKKIRNESKKLKISKEYKEERLKRWEQTDLWKEWNLRDKHYYPDHFPPFKEFWIDDEERIYVEIYEEGERPEEALLYIFNPEGIFIGIKSLKKAMDRKFKNNRLYCVYRKESGYEELVVYKIRWE